MANLTRNQVKARVRKLLEAISPVRDELEELQSDTQQEAEDIEPYGDKWELTPAQEERQEALQEIADQLSEYLDSLDELISNLEDLTY